MQNYWKALIAAFIAAGVVNLGGVLLFFNPIAQSDTFGEPIVPPIIGFLVYILLSVALFNWTARQLRNAYKAAFVVAASQFILVNVDFVLAGKRGLMTGMASTVLLIVTWASVAFVYSYFVRWEDS